MINTLTGLRGYAAIMIVLFHILWNNREYYDMGIGRFILWDAMKMFCFYGWVAVDSFFVLSGFILTYKYYQTFTERLSVRVIFIFILKRFIRIYPLHLISLLLCIALSFAGLLNDTIGNFDALIYHFTLTFTWWFYPQEYGGTWNIPSWSLSAEWMSYFLLIPITLILRKNIIILILGLIVVFTIISEYGVIYPEDPFASIKRVLVGLLIGYFSFHLYNNKKIITQRMKNHSDKIVFLAIGPLFLCIFYIPIDTLTIFFMPYVFLVMSLTIIFLPDCKGIMKFMFDNKVILYLGNISYSVYIFQYPIYVFLDQYKLSLLSYMTIDGQLSQNLLWIFVICVIFIIIGFASIFHYLVEKPIMKYFKTRLIL